ncbi:hypothetical protein BGZ54_007743 [Gamsiella multidivaricata]|nr:hypothetical protein BGZ54_007743 [Gamsiella multidivaricata]
MSWTGIGNVATTLPEYKAPTAFVRLDTMPLTNSGKIDRCALPEPDLNLSVAQGYETPRGEIERVLVATLSVLLKIDKIGWLDNFFMLGGHSLLAVRPINSIRFTLGHSLRLWTLFSASAVAELA